MKGQVGNVDLARLEIEPGQRVVDVGSGEGVLGRQLAEVGVRVVGVEPDPELRHRSAHVADGAGAFEVVDGLADRIPLDDRAADAAVITEVLEHVPDPDAALREIHRVLRPGAVLCLSVPTSYTELLFWRLHPRYAENATHVRIFTRRELERSLRAAGFEVVRWEGRNFRHAVPWIFHALLRSESDHTGAIKSNGWLTFAFEGLWWALGRVRLIGPVEALGNRIWPKSWYVYARAR